MKKLALALLLLLPTTAFAASTKPNPADFTITVHVISSASGTGSNQIGPYTTQVLETTIDSQPVELTSYYIGGVLALGDYKARLSTTVQAPKKYTNTYDIYRGYDLLMPDGTTRSYAVTSLSLAPTNP
jgi:hypothetical protein